MTDRPTCLHCQIASQVRDLLLAELAAGVLSILASIVVLTVAIAVLFGTDRTANPEPLLLGLEIEGAAE